MESSLDSRYDDDFEADDTQRSADRALDSDIDARAGQRSSSFGSDVDEPREQSEHDSSQYHTSQAFSQDSMGESGGRVLGSASVSHAIEVARNIFDDIDRYQDGSIDRDEFVSALRRRRTICQFLGIPHEVRSEGTTSAPEPLFRTLGGVGDSEVTWRQFQDWFLNAQGAALKESGEYSEDNEPATSSSSSSVEQASSGAPAGPIAPRPELAMVTGSGPAIGAVSGASALPTSGGQAVVSIPAVAGTASGGTTESGPPPYPPANHAQVVPPASTGGDRAFGRQSTLPSIASLGDPLPAPAWAPCTATAPGVHQPATSFGAVPPASEHLWSQPAAVAQASTDGASRPGSAPTALGARPTTVVGGISQDTREQVVGLLVERLLEMEKKTRSEDWGILSRSLDEVSWCAGDSAAAESLSRVYSARWGFHISPIEALRVYRQSIHGLVTDHRFVEMVQTSVNHKLVEKFGQPRPRR
mmetsp:Transcript_141072/g.316326  ORF Transcript_141072/g.316326 Transcript_141072/m.316326 type:complete len:472 (+) Transcript_141072:45-1460(+)